MAKRTVTLINAAGSATIEVPKADVSLRGSYLSDDMITKTSEIAIRAANPMSNTALLQLIAEKW